MEAFDHICAYLTLQKQHPNWFTVDESGLMNIVLDEETIRRRAAETGQPFGLVFDNAPYWLVLRDLMEQGYGYARVVYPAKSSGGVCIPYWKEEEQFALLRIFRHAVREESLEFPRGFNEKNLTPEENIRRELAEELGAEINEVRLLGSVRQDTGLCNGRTHVFLASIKHVTPAIGHEGIRDLLWVSRAELSRMIAEGKIVDGFTLSALTLLRACEEAARMDA